MSQATAPQTTIYDRRKKRLFQLKTFSPDSDFISFSNFLPDFQFITTNTLTPK